MVVRNLINASVTALLAGTVALGAGPLASTVAVAAADESNCTAADLAGVMSGVNAGMSAYLFTHPEVNAFFTGLKGQSREQMRAAIVAYAQDNPQVQNEIQAIRQPAADFRDRCNAPIPDLPMG